MTGRFEHFDARPGGPTRVGARHSLQLVIVAQPRPPPQWRYSTTIVVIELATVITAPHLTVSDAI
jgi:hypothetical protein